MDTEPDFRIVDRLLSSLDEEDRGRSLRLLQRETVKEAMDILNSGKKVAGDESGKDISRPFDRNVI